MKNNRIYSIILLFVLPFPAFSLGIGEINVFSFLNQPFHAEIPIIETDELFLSDIHARLASPEAFERIGLKLKDILHQLNFEITSNVHGKPIIEIFSHQRIEEPVLQFILNIAWTHGQLFRTYIVLLDPPGYRIVEKGLTIKKSAYGNLKKALIYGPTKSNENIEEIAQRYTTANASLAQIILAIVGTNSQAFTQGNLNGLKAGERLYIPANDEVIIVPQHLAKEEVAAHDSAWKKRQEIQHVLLPPYVDGVKGISQFENPTFTPNIVR